MGTAREARLLAWLVRGGGEAGRWGRRQHAACEGHASAAPPAKLEFGIRV